MERLPSPEERQWLIHALKKLVSRRGLTILDSAPLVEPDNRWFPEPWNTTASHGHRLAQRLMHYAGLGGLRVSLQAYEPVWHEGEARPWDAGTAAWFAGIRDSRAHFGLHVRQFEDPEAAAGALAHEVAHAWRAHQHIVVDDREKEEFLTDVTTVALGFGILTTNNTDRYRSSGTWNETTWSVSSVGYLPPQAMAYLLALWCAAREQNERRTIERHLEPNQLGYFRSAFEEIEGLATSARDLLATRSPGAAPARVDPAKISTSEPAPDEISEPDRASVDPLVRQGQQVYRKRKGSPVAHALGAGALAFAFGMFPGAIAADMAGRWDTITLFSIALAFSIAAGAYAWRRASLDVCASCETDIALEAATCPGCGGNAGPRVTDRQLRRIREDELDRRAALDIDYGDCTDCEPEHPCPAHQPNANFDPDSGAIESK